MSNAAACRTPDLDPASVEKLMEEFMVWVMKCDEMKKLMETTTGETREAYALVHRDFLWKLQSRAGKLWFYLCGTTELNPFDRPAAGTSTE